MELSHSQAVIRLQDIKAELERLEAKDDLTTEDEQSFDELTREFAEVNAHRKQLERKSALEKVRSATKTSERGGPAAPLVERGTHHRGDDYDLDPILNPDSVEDRRFRNPWDLGEVRTFGRNPDEVNDELRSRALCAIEKMPGTSDRVRQAGTKILERWDDRNSYIARLVLHTSSPAYMRAWCKKARDPQGADFTPEERQAWQQAEAFRAMTLTDSAGGYLVPFQLDPTVIITGDISVSEIRQVARQVVATGDVWNGVSSGAVSWSWDAEGSEVSDDAPGFGQPSIPIHTARGFVPISMEALQDEANVTATVAELLSEGRTDLEAAAFVVGTGAGQPTGIVTALSGTASEVPTGGVGTFDVDDVYAVQGGLGARYRRNGSWLGNNLVYNKIRGFDTAGGSSFWTNLGNGTPEQLLGRRVLEAEDMAGTVATGNELLVFGDFRNYVIADRVGMTVEFIPHLFHTANNRPSGQRGWFASYRTGADSVNDGAFRMLTVA
ncbi:phage major capsid protein [Streptomyces sp. NPDC045251]|uniref:phage major capsid protein n=1 Tax=unclassified Streptomyces TaxID=2593676 RepID=UPI0033DE4C91